MGHTIPGRGIPPRGVAPPLHMPNMLGRRSTGRLAIRAPRSGTYATHHASRGLADVRIQASVKTLVDLFRSLEARRGEFLVYDDGYRVRRHSYADVTRAARGFAARLRAAGVAKDDKVLLWGENRPEWIVAIGA